jgi:hypothetical protein
LGLSATSVIVCNLFRGSHRRRRENPGQRNTRLLNDGEHIVSPFAAQLLVQSRATDLRSVTLHLDHRARCVRNLLHEIRKLILIFLADRGPTVREVDREGVLVLVLIQRTDPRIRLTDRLLILRRVLDIRCQPLLGGVDILRVLRNLVLARFDVLAIAPQLVLGRRSN